MNENENLLKELCIELRWVGCSIDRTTCNSLLDKQTIDYIVNVKDISRKLSINRDSIEKRLAILSRETGWSMSKLFNACLEFPKRTPKMTDIKTSSNERILSINTSDKFKYFADSSNCSDTKAYINGNEIKLFLPDDYGQTYSNQTISTINYHLNNLEKGVAEALLFIRENKQIHMVSTIINDYLEYCNNYFTPEKKLLAFSNIKISQKYFLENLNVKALYICIDDDGIDFMYDVFFGENSLKKYISVVENEYFIVQELELSENIYW